MPPNPKVLEASATSTGSPDRLWDVLRAVSSWAEWVPSMTSVTPLDPARAPGLAARFRVDQTPLPPGEYEITNWEPGREFTWVTSVTGATTCIRYAASADPAGSRLDIDLWWSGFASRWVRRAMRERAQAMIDAQAQTLAARANRGAGGGSPPTTDR